MAKKGKKTGNFEPKKLERKGGNRKIKDEEKFPEFLTEHQDKTIGLMLPFNKVLMFLRSAIAEINACLEANIREQQLKRLQKKYR